MIERRRLGVAALLGSAGLALLLGALMVPLLAAAGERVVSSALFSGFGFFCHQMPERSYFLAGHQVAVCHRYLAIFAGAGIAGLWSMRGAATWIGLRSYLIASLPLVIDGTTQLFGWRESDAVLRTITGLVFGAASVAYWSPLGARSVTWFVSR